MWEILIEEDSVSLTIYPSPQEIDEGTWRAKVNPLETLLRNSSTIWWWSDLEPGADNYTMIIARAQGYLDGWEIVDSILTQANRERIKCSIDPPIKKAANRSGTWARTLSDLR